MNSKGFIKQIIPATGWWTKWKNDDGKVGYLPVAVWALTADGDVVGMDSDSNAHCLVAMESGIGGFLGYVHESEVPLEEREVSCG